MGIITIIFAGLGVLANGDKAADVLLLNPPKYVGRHEARMTVRLQEVDLKNTTVTFSDSSIDPDGQFTKKIYLEGREISVENKKWPVGKTLQVAQGSPHASGDISHVASLKRIWGDDKIARRDQVTTTIHLTSGRVSAAQPSKGVWTFKSIDNSAPVTVYDEAKGEGLSEDVEWKSLASGESSVVSLVDPKTGKEEHITFKKDLPITIRISNLPASEQMVNGRDHFMAYYDLLNHGKAIDLDKRPYGHFDGADTKGGPVGKCYMVVMSE